MAITVSLKSLSQNPFQFFFYSVILLIKICQLKSCTCKACKAFSELQVICGVIHKYHIENGCNQTDRKYDLLLLW